MPQERATRQNSDRLTLTAEPEQARTGSADVDSLLERSGRGTKVTRAAKGRRRAGFVSFSFWVLLSPILERMWRHRFTVAVGVEESVLLCFWRRLGSLPFWGGCSL